MSIEQSDKEAAAVQKTENRVTLESIKDKIAEVEYHSPALNPTMTIAIVKMKNGFVLIGKSAPADPENFNAELGQKFALEDVMRQAWAYEGYLLREKLAA
ncbi:MAG: Gp49 family protein [Alphaproteobacteria bacterium]|jgi:hypothetical protein|nr:Gp49 family protein [Alphaproteobacteria bacterium]